MSTTRKTIDQHAASADLDAIETAVKAFASTHLDAESSAHLGYRTDVDRLLGIIQTMRGGIHAASNLKG